MLLAPLLAFMVVVPAQAVAETVDFNLQTGAVNERFQASIRRKLEEIVAQQGVVGATAVVVVDGKLQAAVGAGLRKFGSPEPLLVTDPMHTGSNTKGMTALLFGRLVEQGRLRFEQTLKEVFPESVSEEFAKVPLIEVLRQRSGFADGTVPNLFDKKYLPQPPADSLHGPLKLYSEERQRFAKDCVAGKAGYPPGTRFVYQNANYIVAGAAEEIASGGRPWEELLQAEVLAPLHMKSAGFGAMGTGKDVKTPWQHRKKGEAWTPIHYDNPRYLGPAGTVHCSALDLANYAFSVAQGAAGRGSFLSAKTWKTLLTPPVGSPYACGVLVTGPESEGVRDMSHRGSNTLSDSEWWVRDHGRVVVVLMLNCHVPSLTSPLQDLLRLTEQSFGIGK